MSPGQTGHITGQPGRPPRDRQTHIRGVPPKFFMFIGFSFLNKKVRYSQGLEAEQTFRDSKRTNVQI